MSAQAEMFGPNPDRYRRLAVPFTSAEEARAALEAFYQGVAVLRAECKVPDLLVALSYSVTGEKGEEMQAAEFFFGDERNAEMLAALALGKEQENHRRRVAAMVERVPPTVEAAPPAPEGPHA